MWAKQSSVTLSSILRFVGVRSAQSLTAKANAPLMFQLTLTGKPNPDITFLQ